MSLHEMEKERYADAILIGGKREKSFAALAIQVRERKRREGEEGRLVPTLNGD